MNRKYTLVDYTDKVEFIRKNIPSAAINTDLMPGFPGETDSIWNESFENIRKLNFSRIHVFPYSKRRNTPAYSRPDHIHPEVINARVNQLLKLGKDHQAQYARQFLGKDVSVLIEEKREDGRLTGFTENYIRCYLPENSRSMGEIVSFAPTTFDDSDLSLS